MSYIYKTTNLISGKSYIGQSIKKVKQSKTYIGSGNAITKAIKKYGKENFKKEILIAGNFNRHSLNELEIKYIQLYNTMTPNGYNLNKGGSYIPDSFLEEYSKPVYQFDKDKNLIKEFKSIKECIREMGYNMHTLLFSGGECRKYGYKYSLNKEYPSDNRIWATNISKKILAKNIITNEILEYKSQQDAVRNLDVSRNTIVKAAKTGKIYKDYVFSETSDFNINIKNKRIKCVVLHNDEECLIFFSYKEAANYINQVHKTNYNGKHISDKLRASSKIETFYVRKIWDAQNKVKVRHINERDNRPIKMFNTKGELLKIYVNTREAAKDNKIKNIGILQNAIRLKQLCYNKYFTRNDFSEFKLKIVAKSINNENVLYFHTTNECANTLNINRNAVTDRCIGRIVSPINNYIISYNN